MSLPRDQLPRRVTIYDSTVAKQFQLCKMRLQGDLGRIDLIARMLVKKGTVGDIGSDLALELASETLWAAILLAAPLILITALVGLAASILQVATQIQESSISFVPKLIAAAFVLLLLGGWMLSTLAQFATRLIASIPSHF